MIHAYAIEPEVAASWADARTFRLVIGQFGVGTPRAMLEIPKFSKWKRAVYQSSGGSDLDKTRLAELFRVLGGCRVRRRDVDYDGNIAWLKNAEQEHQRCAFAAIIAMANPRRSQAVLEAADVGDTTDPRWAKPLAATPFRQAHAMAAAVAAMLRNCCHLHLVDPYLKPWGDRHWPVLEAFLRVAARAPSTQPQVTLHCRPEHVGLRFFEQRCAGLADELPCGLTLRFKRWEEQEGGEKFHNRYLLTDLGGATFGVGLDQGRANQTEDIHLMDRKQYERRWGQFCGSSPTLRLVDEPAAVTGRRRPGARRRR